MLSRWAHHNQRWMRFRSLPLIVLGAGVVFVTGVGCGVPGLVNGIVQQRDFSLECEVPLAKVDGPSDSLLVVLSQHDEETLRTVSLSLPAREHVRLGEEYPVGKDEDVAIEAVVGGLVEEELSDGRVLVYHDDPVQSEAMGGTLRLSQYDNDQVAGSFAVDLDDGGYLDGSFSIDASHIEQ